MLEERMREFGFTDHIKEHWYFYSSLQSVPRVTFNLTLHKENMSVIDHHILDEDNLQPYFYGTFHSNNSLIGIVNEIDVIVDSIENFLGFSIGFDHSHYVV